MHGFLKINFETLTTPRVVWKLFLKTISFFFKKKKRKNVFKFLKNKKVFLRLENMISNLKKINK